MPCVCGIRFCPLFRQLMRCLPRRSAATFPRPSARCRPSNWCATAKARQDHPQARSGFGWKGLGGLEDQHGGRLNQFKIPLAPFSKGGRGRIAAAAVQCRVGAASCRDNLCWSRLRQSSKPPPREFVTLEAMPDSRRQTPSSPAFPGRPPHGPPAGSGSPGNRRAPTRRWSAAASAPGSSDSPRWGF